VPAELAVVGMDDIEMSAYTDPPLTTVHVAKDAMGRLAADWLIGLIEGHAPDRPIPRVPAELIVRGTCGGGPGNRLAAPAAPTGRSTIVTTEGA
jgi:LacI family transcriptional regulator